MISSFGVSLAGRRDRQRMNIFSIFAQYMYLLYTQKIVPFKLHWCKHSIDFRIARSQGKFYRFARVLGEAFPTGPLLPGSRHEGRIWQPFFFADVTEETANLQKR